MNHTAVHNFDVIIIGAGIAGCTVATLYGRFGLTVALIERQPDSHAYKKLCTHYIQASAKPILDRLGVSERIEAVGGVRNGIAIWTKSGWIRPSADPRYPPHGYSLRREKLDPLLRQLATETPGVTFFIMGTPCANCCGIVSAASVASSPASRKVSKPTALTAVSR